MEKILASLEATLVLQLDRSRLPLSENPYVHSPKKREPFRFPLEKLHFFQTRHSVVLCCFSKNEFTGKQELQAYCPWTDREDIRSHTVLRLGQLRMFIEEKITHSHTGRWVHNTVNTQSHMSTWRRWHKSNAEQKQRRAKATQKMTASLPHMTNERYWTSEDFSFTFWKSEHSEVWWSKPFNLRVTVSLCQSLHHKRVNPWHYSSIPSIDRRQV
jgi:hypothetical protein